MDSKSIDYKSSGVDVEAGDALVDWLQAGDQKIKFPHSERIVSGIGGFASLFRADFPQMKKPCLVTCTDGVGTKVKLASHYGRYEGIGQDLVGMCVNDLICTGGEPLLFLDYYATGKLNLEHAKAFLQSVRQACLDSHCALVGGETAEMPGVYQGDDFDCAGFAVGVVDEEKTLGAHRVQKSDVLIGISSSGCHSNGYSLLRKVFENDMDQWVEQLLTPTALYVQVFKALRDSVELHALAHITGGGIENIPRVLPESLTWRKKDWQWPALFKEVQKRTGMDDEKMLRTLNCGIGLVLVLPASERAKAQAVISSFGFQSHELGDLQ
ncbi:MAG: phosphoribosylformylglycinamidine cyclo-ligase [Pseudobdellovibrionaceae bacterium]